MKIVSTINYKGGVGKTSVTANLGAKLAARGHKTLILDVDPQTNLTFHFVKPDYWKSHLSESKTIKQWFDALGSDTPVSLADLIHIPQAVNDSLLRYPGAAALHIIASHLGLIDVDLELASELAGGTLKKVRKNYFKVHNRLAVGLNDLREEGYDIVLIDCAPNFNIVTRNAIAASDCVLIPAKPDYLSTLGIEYLIRNLKDFVDSFNEYAREAGEPHVKEIAPTNLGVLFTMVQYMDGKPISNLRPYISKTRQLHIPVFKSMIRENKTVFSGTPEFGVPVILIPQSGATYKRVVSEFETFVREFESRL